MFHQPKAVWAVAFVCVVAFMGIGLVDPILPALATSLDATPSQVELLFTSYFAITGIAMLVTGWVSSRLGAKRTLLAGLALIVIFSAAAGAAGSINEIVAFRGFWGLGNAFFIATALATIIGAASGGVSGSIILYETALGLGIASGPLLGGLLGGISWRGPFFGTAALMAIGFVAILILLDKTPAPERKLPLSAPLAALRDRRLLRLAVTAAFYNFGFFTLLAYTPFPLHLGVHELGYVFFGWGLMLALSSVFLAPRAEGLIGRLPALYVAFALVCVDLLVLGLYSSSQTTMIVAVVLAGIPLGVVNTLVTEAVMSITVAERSTVSAAYSFVRFSGGALAPYLAGKLAEHVSAELPFYVGAATVAIAAVVLFASRRVVAGESAREGAYDRAMVLTLAEAD
jgi:MFS family permease